MKNLILASAAVIVLSGGFANAGGIILGSDENDRKVWINTWAGQTEDKKLGRHGSSVSTFSGRKTSGSESVSTFSGGRGFVGIILGSDENDRKVWINRFPR